MSRSCLGYRGLFYLLLLSLLGAARPALACTLPLGDVDAAHPQQELGFFNTGDDGQGFSDRSFDLEMYCWGPHVFTGGSLVYRTTPAHSPDFAVYWSIGWAGRGRLSPYVEYGLDMIELAQITVSSIAYQSSNVHMDQRFSMGLRFVLNNNNIFRVYYRQYLLNGPLVSDGRYAYYGVSYGMKY